jgi:predicted Zn-dependent protease
MSRCSTLVFMALLMFSCAHLPAGADKIPGKPESVITELSIPTKEDQTLNRIGKRLAIHSRNGEHFYHFKLASPSEINAFTLPGGYIYVFSGLVRVLETEDELAGLLAHEIAHNDMRHYAEQFDWKLPLNLFGTGLSLLTLGILPNPIMTALSRRDESEADRVGLVLMVEADFCAQGMRNLMAKLHTIASLGTPHRYVLSHPPTSERLRNIDAMIAAIGAQGCEETPLDRIEILRRPP